MVADDDEPTFDESTGTVLPLLAITERLSAEGAMVSLGIRVEVDEYYRCC